jgi:hypothetical protein
LIGATKHLVNALKRTYIDIKIRSDLGDNTFSEREIRGRSTEIPFIYTLGEEFHKKISTTETNVMGFIGKHPVRCKIIILNSITEQISHFKYLGCDISYEINYDLNYIYIYINFKEYVGQ